jgi:hypothetical protein
MPDLRCSQAPSRAAVGESTGTAVPVDLTKRKIQTIYYSMAAEKLDMPPDRTAGTDIAAPGGPASRDTSGD